MKMLILLLDIIVLPKMLNNNHQFLSEDNFIVNLISEKINFT